MGANTRVGPHAAGFVQPRAHGVCGLVWLTTTVQSDDADDVAGVVEHVDAGVSGTHHRIINNTRFVLLRNAAHFKHVIVSESPYTRFQNRGFAP